MADNKKHSWKEALRSRPYEEHKHCVVCGRAVPLDRDFCSQECKEQYGKADKKKGRQNTIQIVIFGVIMVIMLFVLPRFLG